MLTNNDIEEALSLAYVSAVAGRVGVDMSFQRKDYGIDGTFRPVKDLGKKKMSSGFPIDFQLKASKYCELGPTHLAYDLSVETYDKLLWRRSEGGTPVVLIVHALPDDDLDWLIHSEDHLLLKRCCYWCVVDGTATKNKYNIRIKIPRTQQFNPTALEDLLVAARAGTLK